MLAVVVVLILGLLIGFHQSKSYYCLDANRCVTVWKRLGNECYIIPGKYRGITAPKDNYIRTSNVNGVSIIWDKENSNKIIVNHSEPIEIVNHLENIKIIDYDLSSELNDSLYMNFDGRYHYYKKEIDYISIDIRYNKAKDKNGKNLQSE